MKKGTVFEYQINYEKASHEAEKIAKEICKKYPQLSYKILTRLDEGVFVKLYGDNEELIRKISNSMKNRELKLLLSGTPVYVIYGGQEKILNLPDPATL